MTDSEYREAAEQLYNSGSGGQFCDGDISFDTEPAISEADGGAWVAAWVWVPAEEEAVSIAALACLGMAL